MFSWKKNAWAAIRPALYVVVATLIGVVADALMGTQMQASLNALGDKIADGVPVVGGLLAGPIKGFLIAALVAAAGGLNNFRKHFTVAPESTEPK